MIIIGGGIIGLASAWALHRRAIPCIVLDQEPIRDGASLGNAGLIVYGHPPLTRPGVSVQGLKWMFDSKSPLYIKPRFDGDLARWLLTFHRHCNKPHFEACLAVLAHLGWETARGFDEMRSDASIDCDWRPSGWLDVCLKSSSLDEAQREIEHLAPFGYTAERLDGDALRRTDPAFGDEVAGAVRFDQSATMDPLAFMRSLRTWLEGEGIEIREGPRGGGVERLLTENDRVTGVELASGEVIETDRVVLAAGSWSGPLAATVGLNVPLQPARGYHRELTGLPAMPRMGGVLRETFIAFTPMFDRLRLAGTLEIAGHGRPWSRSRLENLTRAAQPYLRDLDEATITAEWAGYRPCTPDGMPMIGEVPWVKGLVIATGHAMMGMTLGPVTGRLVAEILCDGRPSIESPMLDPARFGRVD
ncbi:MAG: FAD-dependent oxidoreductase [Phycisphaerales bacterium]|nr:FAD-dependent oxidoreductase [Phycisphaerales bacterium]